MEAYDKFSIQIPLCLSWNLAVLQTPDFTFVLSSTVLFILLHPKIPKAIIAFFPRLLVVFFFFLPVLAHYSICMWEKPLVFKVYSNQIYHLLQVAGESQFWFHLGTVSLTCFSLLLFLQSYVMSCLRESCTSAWLVKCLCSEPCLLIDGRKEEMKTSSGRGLPFWDICKINGLFTLFIHLPPSLIYERTWHPDLHKMVILRH